MPLFICEHASVYVTVYRKTGHNAACVNIEKRSIDFLKMYCFSSRRKGTVRSIIVGTTYATTIKLGELNICVVILCRSLTISLFQD